MAQIMISTPVEIVYLNTTRTFLFHKLYIAILHLFNNFWTPTFNFHTWFSESNFRFLIFPSLIKIYGPYLVADQELMNVYDVYIDH